MKRYNPIYFIIVSLFFLFISCAKDESVDINKIPFAAKEYIEKNYPNNYCVGIDQSINDDKLNISLSVTLDNNVTLFFDNLGFIKKASGNGIPLKYLPMVSDELKNNLSEEGYLESVIEIEENLYGIKISIINGEKLAFSPFEGKFIGYDVTKNEEEYKAYVDSINNLVHIDNVMYIIKTDTINQKYLFYSYKMCFTFDNQCKWISIEMNNNKELLPKDIYKIIPQEIFEIINDGYDDKIPIYKIERDSNYYYISFDSGVQQYRINYSL